MSDATIPLSDQPHAKILLTTTDPQQVLTLWNNTDDEILKAIDPVYGSSLLFYAVQFQPHEDATRLARYLVETRKVCDVQHKDANQQTALFFAARDGNQSACEFLLQAGCDGLSRDTAGQIALFYASREGHCDVIRALEAHAVSVHASSVNATDRMGQSALFYAAREGRREACEVLLELGADPSIRDWQKKSAHTYASRRGHVSLGALLKAKSIDARRLNSGADGDRSKVLLQYMLTIESNQELSTTTGEWIFPLPPMIEEFEKEFPQLAAWPHMHASIYKASDAFRMEWSQMCLDVINIVSNYRDAVWFMKPVDVKALNCPDYYDIVKEPRDLSLVKKKLKELEYDTIEKLIRDISLIWENCFRYNPTSSPVYKAGEHIKELFEKAWQEQNLNAFIERERNLQKTLANVSLTADQSIKAAK